MEPCSISISSGRSSSSSSTSSQPESPGTCGTGYDTTFVPLRYAEVPVFLNAGPALCRRKQIETASATPNASPAATDLGDQLSSSFVLSSKGTDMKNLAMVSLAAALMATSPAYA